MNKRILLILLGILLIGAGIYLWFDKPEAADTPQVTDGVVEDVKGDTPQNQAVRAAALSVFDKYTAAAKEGDLASIKELSYKLSKTCSDTPASDECKELISNAAYFSNYIDKSRLTHMISDDSQIIIYGDYRRLDKDTDLTYQRPVLYFMVTESGIKMLSFTPFDGYILHTDGVATSTFVARLPSLEKDTDGDTLADVAETCGEVVQLCVKSDPKKKDSDSNGFWDSIDLILKNR